MDRRGTRPTRRYQSALVPTGFQVVVVLGTVDVFPGARWLACVMAGRSQSPIPRAAGCGDAFRAGLLYGIMNELDWVSTAQIASTLATFKVEHHGGQNHLASREKIFEHCSMAFGVRMPGST